MTGDQIRELFLTFFEGKGHLRMPSASLVPSGDPTLLFTSAGMVPFKPFFVGEQTPPSRRLASSQKCFRTTDIDEVGDHKHLTFFEMLGNFSIGDYFKKEAIRWTWEFVTSKLEGFGLPPDRIFATVHHTDDEAFDLWRDDIGLSPDRVYRYGDEENWWGPAGLEGPCGPCSEIHYDFGAEHGCGQPLRYPAGEGEGCHPNHDCERFVELWNLVFMQYYQDPEGKRTDLPAPSVDTGMGLERAATVMQGAHSIYDTDLFKPLVAKASELSGKAYGQDRDTDYALRVVAEHARAAAFLISDGVVPGNEGRGYVLRRVIRRAIRYGRRLGLEETFLAEVADVAISRFGQAYPDLATNRDFILRVVGLEEERFGSAVIRGTYLLNGMVKYRIQHGNAIPEIIEFARQRNPGSENASLVLEQYGFVSYDPDAEPLEQIGHELAAESASTLTYQAFESLEEDDVTKADIQLPLLKDWATTISGDEAFLLWDTYGFPVEETAAIAREHGLEVDMEGFQKELEAHRRDSRAAHVVTGGMELQTQYEDLGAEAVEFVGYQRLQQESTVAALLMDGAAVGHATQGQPVEVVLKETPFYAEGGGQIGDAGTITGPNGIFNVQDTQSPIAGLIVHRGSVAQGDISLGDTVTAQVDPTRRIDTARNHSGTHLLHASLRSVLGPHVRQAGSLVAPDRLRFDYSHVSPLAREELQEIQSLANQKVREDLKVSTRETTYAEAIGEGALAFFGDKYGDRVRVVAMSGHDTDDPFSLELCGGTHVGVTGEVGPLFILGDSSIGGGMRRVEAVTGRGAEALFQERTDLLQSISRRLDTPIGDLEGRLESFLTEMSALRKRVADLERRSLRTEAQELLSQVQQVDGVKVLAARTSAANVEALREMGDWLKAKLTSAVLVLALVQDGSPLLVSMVTPDLIDRGLHAGNIVREAAQVLGGGGGGRPETAQAGGKRLDKLPEALAKVPEIVRREVKP
ncbi:MAG: alanine--tRNA ligase [Chloroflexi bacterium]|nr:alanine--tRNA ligase [Chloroflexota bacterium]